MTANTPASRKAKGRKFQQQIRDDLVDHLGIDPGDVQSTAMGQAGCDLYLSPAARERFPYGVECKHHETLSIPAWWKQCTMNAEAEGLIPLLVFRRNREEPLAVLRWSDLLRLLAEIEDLKGWADRACAGITIAADHTDDMAQLLSLTSLTMRYRDHIRPGSDHRVENLAEGLCGGERP